MDLDSSKVNGRCADIAGVINAITTDGKTDSAWVCFGRAITGNDAKVSGFAIGRFVRVVNEKHGVTASGHMRKNPLC
jgi:hypothetical protein